jgi:hypothetical protein
MKHALLLLALSAGCGIGLDPLSTETGSDQTGEVGISSVEPNWGHPDEDTVVTITGWGLEGDLALQFGNADLQVTRIGAETIIVTAPAVGFETKVDIQLMSDLGDVTLPEGFSYSYSKPKDDTGETDSGETDTSETGSSGTGQVGGLLHFLRTQIACPSVFGMTDGLIVEGSAAFHSPSSASWLDWQPPTGSCTVNAVPNDMSVTRYDVGEWLYLSAGSTSVGLRRTTGTDGYMYEGSNLSLEDFISNASYDLSVNDGGELGGAFDIPNAVMTPQGFTDIQPYQLLLTHPDAQFTAPVSKSGTYFSWAPSGGTGDFMIQVDVYDPTGASYLGNVVCLGPDNGSMTIPGGLLASYPTGSLLAVKLYRQQVEESIIPINGHTLQAIGHGGVWGTAILY